MYQNSLITSLVIILVLGIYPLETDRCFAETAFPRRNTAEKYGFNLEYSVGQEKLAKKALELLKEELGAVTASRIDGRSLQEKKNQVISIISRELSIKDPPAQMIFSLNRMLQMLDMIEKRFPISSWQLWHKVELKGVLQSGQNITGFKYNQDTDSIRFTMEASSSEQEDAKPIRIPIVIKADDVKNTDDQLRKRIQDVKSMRQRIMPAVLIHEVIEGTITYGFGLKDPHRRWFCDGMANYITSVVLAECFGEKESREFIEGYDITKYHDMKGSVDLITWFGMEHQSKQLSQEQKRKEDARYAFATHEVLELVKRHGKESISAIFAEIQKLKQPTMDDVYSTIEKVTGEDIRKRLAVYSAAEDDP